VLGAWKRPDLVLGSAVSVAGAGFPAVERENREREKRKRWRKMK
jgi:hypothetical protein